MRIGIEFDRVVTNPYAILDVVNKVYGINLKPWNMFNKDINECVSFDIVEKEVNEKFNDWKSYLEQQWREGADVVLEDLMNKHDIFIITDREDDENYEWLTTLYNKVSTTRLLPIVKVTEDNKPQKLEELKLNVMITDDIDSCKNIRSCLYTTVFIRMSTFYNKHQDGIVCKNWYDVWEMINFLEIVW